MTTLQEEMKDDIDKLKQCVRILAEQLSMAAFHNEVSYREILSKLDDYKQPEIKDGEDPF